tara:strand:+ start:370 stop:780 length:411 start_codon:yes stop_codon:yes gene_type:complete
MRLRKDRNPRYVLGLELAKTNNNLIKEVSDHLSELPEIKTEIKKLYNSNLKRTENLTDAYIRLSGRYWSLITRLENREARLNLVERQLKDYVPDHWLFQEDEEPNNTEEEEPEPVTLRTDKDQLEFDFGSFLETKH